MGYENHIRTLGDYSKPSHEGYRNTIELPIGNNVRKELSKETSSKILPCGDGSCWKTFKLIASLIKKGKLK
nr:hypothetical protein [Tanacetum cinerariifolium]